MTTPKKLYLCAILSGLLMYTAFTFASMWWICFFALIPMLTAIFFYNDRHFGQIKFVFVYITAYHLPAMLFLYNMFPLTRYGIGKIPSAVLLTLAIIAIAVIEGAVFVLAFLPYNRLRRTKIPIPIIFAALYITAEFLQGILGEMSFPWCRLGTILCDFTPFIRSAGLFGTMFLSLLIVLINALLAYAIVLFMQRGKYIRPITAIVCAGILFSANLIYGLLTPQPAYEKTVRVAVIQGNISSITDWNTSISRTLDIYLDLSETVDADIILWPEAAIPVYDTDVAMSRVQALATQKNCTVITGIYTRADTEYHDYNSLVAYYPDGTLSEPYSKQKLVPIGEYIPFFELFEPFLQPTVHLIAGASSQPIPVAGSLAGGIICYESIYPEIARRTAQSGAEFYVMSSNDSWFSNTPAQRQHLAHARMRCIENGRWMARAGNTGISAIINPKGQVVNIIPADTQGVLCCEISTTSQKTLYTQIGDIIVLPCIAIWIIGLFCRKRRYV